MREKLQLDQHANKMSFEQHQSEVGFLPDLCSAGSVLSLVLIGELLALALALADKGVGEFSGQDFGLMSFLIQWIILSTAGVLCPLRKVLNTSTPAQAVSISYAIVLFFTALYSVIGMWFIGGEQSISLSRLASNTIIASIFAGVMLRYLYLQQLLKQREHAELSARVQALQSRIRPHFLFNSLNSIASLITIRPESAEKMVVDLAQLFRGSLMLPQLTSIEQEIALCRCFINIETVRLGKRLKVTWLIESLPKNEQILNLLLQPLLENAIYHGVQPLPNGGEVTVEIKQVDDDIVVKIINPLLPGELPVMESEQPLTSQGNGIALSNIRHRLSAYYGEKAYLRVVKGEADFAVIMRYPMKKR